MSQPHTHTQAASSRLFRHHLHRRSVAGSTWWRERPPPLPTATSPAALPTPQPRPPDAQKQPPPRRRTAAPTPLSAGQKWLPSYSENLPIKIQPTGFGGSAHPGGDSGHGIQSSQILLTVSQFWPKLLYSADFSRFYPECYPPPPNISRSASVWRGNEPIHLTPRSIPISSDSARAAGECAVGRRG